MQRRITELEQMQKEYNAFLNYVIAYSYNELGKGEDKVFSISTKLMKSLKMLPIRSEIVDNGERMELRRVDNTKNNDIITLPS